MMGGMSAAAAAELIREALQRLYDPPALAAAPLVAELRGRGTLRAAQGPYELLVDAVDALMPPAAAPSRSHAWRRYRYLRLRYVECWTHEAIAADLELSLRQALRVHHEGLAALANVLLPGAVSTTAAAPAARPSLTDDLAIVGRQPPDGAVDVTQVATGAVETLGRIAAALGIVLELELPADLPPVGVNRVVLRQVLLNLLHANVRGEPGTVRLSASASEGGVVVLVAREGAPSQPDAEGTALLAAATQLAALQGARVDAGATGPRLWLPRGRVKSVLVVDDNPEVGDLFRRMLGGSWYHPTHVRTAQRAVRRAVESHPDVIVLDVVMPGQDGWEVMATLQTDPQTRDIPVVVCSVLPDRELALSLGAADFLAKPVTRPALVAVLERVSSGGGPG